LIDIAPTNELVLVVSPLCFHFDNAPPAKHLLQIISILQDVHKKKIKHCDPACRNWLETEDGNTILNDFGSCIIEENETDIPWMGANSHEIPGMNTSRSNMTDNDDFIIAIRSYAIYYFLMNIPTKNNHSVDRKSFDKYLGDTLWKTLLEAAKVGNIELLKSLINSNFPFFNMKAENSISSGI
jgi:serine/threonine protein kinase